METKNTDILIIGGGLAAMMAALEAADSSLSILMVSKGAVGNSGLGKIRSSVAACTKRGFRSPEG